MEDPSFAAAGALSTTQQLYNYRRSSATATNGSLEFVVEIEGLLIRGQREQALALALENHDWPLALLISPVVSQEKYQEVARKYSMTHFLPSSPLNFAALMYSSQGSVFLEDSQMNKPDFFVSAGPAMSSLSSTIHKNWKSIVSTLFSNKPDNFEFQLSLLSKRLYKATQVSKPFFFVDKFVARN